MSFSETYCGTFSQLENVADAINAAATAAGITFTAQYIPAADTSYTTGLGGLEFYSGVTKIASTTNTGSNVHTQKVFGDEWDHSATATFSNATAAANTIVTAFCVGKTLAIIIGSSTATTKARYSGGFIFSYSKNAKPCVILTSIGASSPSDYPTYFNTAWGVSEYDNALGALATRTTLNGTTGLDQSAQYRGNFMYNYPVFTQENEPNYLSDVYVCGVCQYYDKPTYAEIAGKRYLFLGHIAIIDEIA